MSEFMDKIYDDMDLKEVICRLPGELAVKAIKRRIKKADDLTSFFEAAAVEKETSKCEEVRNHLNDIVKKYSDIKEVISAVSEVYHPVLHGYLNDGNKKRLLEEGAEKLSIQFHFNLTNSKDISGMKRVLNRILLDAHPQISQVLSVLNKIDPVHFQEIANTILSDQRANIRSSILHVYNEFNYKTISEHQKMIALKAFAKIPSSEEGPKGIQPIDFKLFKSMKPLERLLALDRYLSYFPVYQKRKAFNPEPTKEDFEAILFAGCFEYYDLVEGITNKYKAITEEEAKI